MIPAFPKCPDGKTFPEKRAERKADTKTAGNAVREEAKRRDGKRCRWPHCEYRHVGQVIDAAHVTHAAGMGGDQTLIRTTRQDLMAICRLHHRLARLSLHNANLRVEPLTPAGTDGPCQFYSTDADGREFVVAQETAPFIYARD